MLSKISERFRTRSRSRRVRGYGRVATRAGDKASAIHDRRRVHRLFKRLKRKWDSCRRARTEVHRQRNASLSQLYPGVQRGLRNGGYPYAFNTHGSGPSAKVATWPTESEGQGGGCEEETFKGSRKEVVSWIKGYASKRRCPTTIRLLP